MPAPSPCQPCCTTTPPVNVPGVSGDPGTDGSNGQNAFTTTTVNITLPASAGPVVGASSFTSTEWMAIGQVIFISDGIDWAHFRVLTLPSATSATIEWLDYENDAIGASVIGSGAKASPSGTQPPLSAALPTALTDNTTGTASNTLAAGVGVFTLAFPIQLAAMTTLAADLMTNYTPGFAFKVLAVDFVTTTIGAGAGATQQINLEIGSTNLTGGVVNPTLAGTDTLGELTAGTAVTANNVGTASDTLSIEVAAGGTVFTAGAGAVLVKIQNMDQANAAASLADHINDLITALT